MADDFTADVNTTGTLDSGIAAGNLEVGGDHDWFRVTLYGGHNYVIDDRGSVSQGGTLFDPLMSLHNQIGTSIATDDDSGATVDSQLAIHVSATGVYFVDAGAFSQTATGTYTLQLTDLGIGSATDRFQAPTEGSIPAQPPDPMSRFASAHDRGSRPPVPLAAVHALRRPRLIRSEIDEVIAVDVIAAGRKRQKSSCEPVPFAQETSW